MNGFVLKGDLCYSVSKDKLVVAEDSWLVCVDGVSAGVYRELPPEFRQLPCRDFTGSLIIPGLVDLHVHACQYAFRGTGMDYQLLDWLNNLAFPEEARYADPGYARKAYEIFFRDLRAGGTTRAVIFGTIHRQTTGLLMDLAEESGLITMVGKVNMDRNSPAFLTEGSAEQARRDTVAWLEETQRKGYRRTRPILTPRFIPSCSDELMEALGRLARERGLPVQSHLSENAAEIEWVARLCPWARCYGDAYDRFGLFGGDVPAIMAHCVHSSQAEVELMKERGVYVAHCPQSNTNLASGIAPVRRYLEEGLRVGLGSDIAGGGSLSIFRAMTDAIQVSKLRWRLVDQTLAPLTVAEAFYLGTKGGGGFFGRVGSFERGYELDALVLSEDNLPSPRPLSVEQRLERFLYLADDRNIRHKFVAGSQLF